MRHLYKINFDSKKSMIFFSLNDQVKSKNETMVSLLCWYRLICKIDFTFTHLFISFLLWAHALKHCTKYPLLAYNTFLVLGLTRHL